MCSGPQLDALATNFRRGHLFSRTPVKRLDLISIREAICHTTRSLDPRESRILDHGASDIFDVRPGEPGKLVILEPGRPSDFGPSTDARPQKKYIPQTGEPISSSARDTKPRSAPLPPRGQTIFLKMKKNDVLMFDGCWCFFFRFSKVYNSRSEKSTNIRQKTKHLRKFRFFDLFEN